MAPEAHVSHAIPRRLRIGIPSKKGCSSYFSEISNGMSNCTGVESVRVNASIGSVTIVHDCKIHVLADYARRHGLFSLKRDQPRRQTMFQQVAAAFASCNSQLKGMTNGEIDIPSVVFLSLIASGIWQVARGNLVMPAWYTAFYYALGVFSSAKVDEFDAGEGLDVSWEDADPS